jgi:RNA polymerase sigma factor (sigma-70 family)
MENVFDNSYSDTEDKKLIVNALGGSKTALEHLLKRHYQFIYNVAFKFVLTHVDAQDLTQEVVIKVILKLSQFNHQSEFRTWLYRIIFNHFLNSKRRKKEHDIISFDAFGSALDNMGFDSLTTNEETEYQDKIEDVKIGCMTAMLLCLNRDQRLVYILSEIFEVDSNIGAELLEISADNFRQILARSKKDLYNFMNNKCGLVNTDNPCRCFKKTKGFIKAGFVNETNLQFNNYFAQHISEIAVIRTNECDNLIEEKYASLYKDHPFYNKEKSANLIFTLTADPQFKTIFNL